MIDAGVTNYYTGGYYECPRCGKKLPVCSNRSGSEWAECLDCGGKDRKFVKDGSTSWQWRERQ